MIELLLLVQTATTAVVAFFVIKLRRELYPMVATAGPVNVGFWIRSADVLVLAAPQFEVAKTVIKIRWLTSEELFLKHRFRLYDVAMDPLSRHNYRKWRAWLSGDDRYRCVVKKPRGFAKIYNKAIDVICREERRPKEVIILPSRMRKRGKRIIEVY
jgi:hypothetical protein